MMSTNGSKEDPKGQRNIQTPEMLKKKLQIEAKLAKPVNIHRVRISCIPWDAICISTHKSHLHCYQFPTIYRAVK